MVIFDDRIAQKFVASLVQLFAHRFAVALDFDLEIFADVDGIDSVVTHVFEGVLNSLALGIEHGLFRRNGNLSFH